MICVMCHGIGMIQKWALSESVTSLMVPCYHCGGSGFTYCCERIADHGKKNRGTMGEETRAPVKELDDEPSSY